MSDFKVGDKVLCIRGSEYKLSGDVVKAGNYYTIETVHPTTYVVEGIRGGWNKERFVAATPTPTRTRVLQTTSEERKKYPMASGLMDYFPDALAEVAKVSYLGNEKHNPGQPLHWSRGKSMDHADCIVRHLVGRGGFDGETRESAALAWRALALLQQELEDELKLPLPRGAK